MAQSSSPRSRVWTPRVLKRFGQLALLTLTQAGLLFGSAGRLDWGAGWLYLLLYVSGLVAAAVVMLPAHADVIASRTELAPKHGWDRAVMVVYSLAGLAILIVGGLDERFDWTAAMAPAWRALGVAGYVAGYGVFVWAMWANAYFAAVSRAQPERGQQVAQGGPYRFVRHPGYAGLLVFAPACAAVLDSTWVLIPAAALMASIVARTAFEDRMLRAELPGYTRYAQRVRYRLIPGVW